MFLCHIKYYWSMNQLNTIWFLEFIKSLLFFFNKIGIKLIIIIIIKYIFILNIKKVNYYLYYLYM